MAHKDMIAELFTTKREAILDQWLAELKKAGIQRDDLMREQELRDQCAQLIRAIAAGVSSASDSEQLESSGWKEAKVLLDGISRTRVRQGFTPSQVATFVLSLKRPLFNALRAEISDANLLEDEIWRATDILDRLGIWTMESYQKAREEVIFRQQQEMMELSTPVVKLWDGIVALPLIGTLDSTRSGVIMEVLLQRIVESGSEIAIIDITGVPTVDTLVAQHLMKTVAAARLMGAECIISGIRPQIAQTIVHLGVELNDVITKATLAAAFEIALQKSGKTIVSIPARSRSAEHAGKNVSG